jgi:RES domain-containing protein
MVNRKPGDDFDVEIYNFDTTEFVCPNHFQDSFINKKIKEVGSKGICSYCNKNRIVIELSELLKLIVIGIEYLFEDPNDSRYYNKDGIHGFDGNTFDFYDLWYEDYLDLRIENNKLIEDIYSYLSNDTLYCFKDEYTSESDYLDSIWTEFKETVKHNARFVFHFKGLFKGSDYSDPIDILNKVQNSILKFNFISELPANTILYRARQHSKPKEISKANEMASTPVFLSKANGRMNPAGISMFYCSKSKGLTLKEVVDFNDTKKPYYTTAIFRNNEILRLVDLSFLPPLGSVFDETTNRERETLTFLKDFISDISKPIDDNDSIIEYIPTQIVTEYIRFNPKLNVDGIIYPSSKDNSQYNVVLFYNHDESMEKLTFSTNSLKTVKI